MFRRSIASLLILSLVVPLPASAGMVATDKLVMTELVQRADVRAQLRAYGVDPAEVDERVAALTEEEAAELAARIESLPAGGIDLLGAILVVFLVLLLTDILGYTKVFPFTRPIK